MDILYWIIIIALIILAVKVVSKVIKLALTIFIILAVISFIFGPEWILSFL